MRFITVKIASIAALVFAAAGCMSSPTDGQWFNNREDIIHFSGYVPAQGEMINVEAWERSLDGRPAGWANVASTQAGFEPVYTDSSGVKWYAWSVDTKLHYNNKTKLLRWVPQGHSMHKARVRAWGWSIGTFTTFRSDLNQCLAGNTPLSCGGADVATPQEAINECGTGTKEAAIYAVD